MAIFNSELLKESIMYRGVDYLSSIQESVHEGVNPYQLSVQIVAECAYNDIIMESYVQNILSNIDIITEGFTEKIKSIFDKLIGMVKKFWSKIKEFFGKFNKIIKEREDKNKEKQENYKKKKEEYKKSGKKIRSNDILFGFESVPIDPIEIIDFDQIDFEKISFKSEMRLYEILQQFSDADQDDNKRNAKTQDYIKLSKGKLNGSNMSVSEYVNYAYKETATNSIKDCKCLSSLYNKIKDMDSKDEINKEVKNMVEYLPKKTLKTSKDLFNNIICFISNIRAVSLEILFDNEKETLNKEIKQLEDCKKEVQRWASGGAGVEAEIGIDRVNHFKSRQQAINNSLNALSGCVTSILTYMSTLNASVQQAFNKRQSDNNMMDDLLNKTAEKYK